MMVELVMVDDWSDYLVLMKSWLAAIISSGGLGEGGGGESCIYNCKGCCTPSRKLGE